jgi:hypothetical protein
VDGAYRADHERWPDEPGEDARLAAAFMAVRDRHEGESWAPLDDLPAEPERIATALERELGRATEPVRVRRIVEALVDLQAFRAVDDQGSIARAQAAAVSVAGGGSGALGVQPALEGWESRIGHAREALDRVGRRRDLQRWGVAGMAAWPVAAAAGWAVGAALSGPAFGLAVALVIGWWFAPVLGVTVGRLVQAIDGWESDRSPSSTDRLRRGLAAALGWGLLLGVPAAVALAGAWFSDLSGLP